MSTEKTYTREEIHRRAAWLESEPCMMDFDDMREASAMLRQLLAEVDSLTSTAQSFEMQAADAAALAMGYEERMECRMMMVEYADALALRAAEIAFQAGAESGMCGAKSALMGLEAGAFDKQINGRHTVLVVTAVARAKKGAA